MLVRWYVQNSKDEHLILNEYNKTREIYGSSFDEGQNNVIVIVVLSFHAVMSWSSTQSPPTRLEKTLKSVFWTAN